MFRQFIIPLLFATALPLPAVPRPWKSADGERSIQGDFVKRDTSGVIIRRGDGKEVTIPFGMLHSDDLTWLNVNHPVPGTEVPDPSAVFDQIAFGDTRQDVLEKLKTSKFVESTLDDIFLGRSGLNGVFRTRKKIGGMDTMLYFDWTDANQLKEILLQTATYPASSSDSSLVPCWKELIDLLTTLNGKPIHENNKFELAGIEDGSMSGTHIWKLAGNGSAVLGPAREGDKYQVVVRFTQENIKPVIIPAPTPMSLQSP